MFTKASWSKKRIIKLLDCHLKTNGENVLDAGCGSGFFSRYFLGSGCKVWACDYSKDAIALTRKNTSNECESYLKKDLLDKESWGEYANSFDVIFTDGLFEHFNSEQQQKLIDNFISIKKADGLIITFVPNKLSWWTIIRPMFMPGIEEKPFTMRRLVELHSGLEIVSHGGINTLPVRYSPDNLLGSRFGMLLYVVAK